MRLFFVFILAIHLTIWHLKKKMLESCYFLIIDLLCFCFCHVIEIYLSLSPLSPLNALLTKFLDLKKKLNWIWSKMSKVQLPVNAPSRIRNVSLNPPTWAKLRKLQFLHLIKVSNVKEEGLLRIKTQLSSQLRDFKFLEKSN